MKILSDFASGTMPWPDVASRRGWLVFSSFLLNFLQLQFLLHFIGFARAIHHELSVPELVQTFGVARHEHVPDYHMLHAFGRDHSPRDGQLRSIRFQAWNSSFWIDLRPNHRLISPHLISVIRDAHSNRTHHGLPEHLNRSANCHFHGRVRTHGNLHAAISDCRQRLMGVIVHDEHFWMLQTLPERMRRKKGKDHPHYLIYKRHPSLLNPLEHWPKHKKSKWSEDKQTLRLKRSLEEPKQIESEAPGDPEEGQLFCDVLSEFGFLNGTTSRGALPMPLSAKPQQKMPPMERLSPAALLLASVWPARDDADANGTSPALPPELANYTLPSAAKLDSLFIFPQLDPITLEIGLFLDSQLFEHFQREFTAEPEQHLTDFSLALINNVHVLYQQPSLSPNLDIVIVRFEMWKSQPVPLATELHKNGQAQTLLDSFCRHQARINPGTDLTDPGHWDHAVLLTGYDIYHTTASVAGVAPVGRMCDELFACSLVEGLHLGRSFVLAHEMGHNMGMVHDGVQNQCGRSCCLMSAVNGAGKTTWSSCSVREFNAFLLQLDESGKGNCLRDPSESIISHDHNRDGRLPGQRFTADQQCSYFWGRDFQVEIPNGRSYEDICRILWCGNSGSTISTAHPALEGSWCGGEKWCHQGQCEAWRTEMGPYPTVIDGRWSDWTSAEKQCPVTQCQISGSIALISQLRTCTAPAPNNGGRNCEGANVRGIVCGGARSICEGFTRQEYGDRLCSAILHDPVRPDRQLTGGSFLHATHPCKIWCHVRDSELIRNKGQYPNGSPCGPNHFCVGGVCLTMSCDNRAIVQTNDDCPSEKLLQQLSTGLTLKSGERKRESAKWEQWSGWGQCSATCGDHGVQKRSRKCRSPVETECVGKTTEIRPCEPALTKCEKLYSDWEDWTQCAGECGKNGTRKRERKCLSSSSGAEICTEPLLEEEKCRIFGCAHWKEWGPWSECICGDVKSNERSRSRKCSVEGAEGDAELGCPGESVQHEQCTANNCQPPKTQQQQEVDRHWGEWQPCSVSCGIGFQFREQFCGDRPCPGSGKQARTCNVQDCSRVLDAPVWSDWSLWSVCSRSCGQGVQQRFRRCLNGLCPSGEPQKEQKRCVLGPCPQWTIWSPWTKCASCSVFETRKRQRKCVVRVNNQDETELGHEACTGAPIEFDTCERSCLEDALLNSTTNTKENPVKAHGTPIQNIGENAPKWAEWGQWSPCSATCGPGMRQRLRQCQEGADCGGGVGVELEQCRAVDCGKTDRGKDDLGVHSVQPTTSVEDRRWGDWSEWSACSVTCGPGGRQSRSRQCRAKLIFLCGDGYSREERECVPAPPECPPVVVDDEPANGSTDKTIHYPAWSDWSEWSACSCFSLTRYRRRFCRVRDPQLKGFCPGSIIDQSPCTPSAQEGQQCAAVAGGWSQWSAWSQCSQDCGQRGHRIRNRMCANPLPSNRGAYCIGFSFDQMPCDPPKPQCTGPPIDGHWSEWTDWSQCSNPCVNGQRSRARYCSNPRPRNGGRPCTGSDFELQACSEPTLCGASNGTGTFTNSTDLHWTPWSSWSECTPGCGFSLRRRHRQCTTANGVCEGEAQQSVECGSGEPCKTIVHDGHWSDWSEWSGNCEWDACVGFDPNPMMENDQQLEGSGENLEFDDNGVENVNGIIGSTAHALLAQALGTRTRTRTCVGPSAGGFPCFGPTVQNSVCPKRTNQTGTSSCAHSPTLSQLMAHLWNADFGVLQQILRI